MALNMNRTGEEGKGSETSELLKNAMKEQTNIPLTHQSLQARCDALTT